MSYVIDTTEYKGHTIDLVPDEGSESPREAWNVAELVQLSDRFQQPDAHASLADVIAEAWDRTRDFDTVARYLRSFFDVVAVDSWDDPRSSSRVVGYVTREAALANWDAYGSDYRKYVRDCLAGELATYAAWSEGEVYGAIVDDEESCFDFYSEAEALEWAHGEIEYRVNMEHAKRVEMYRKLVNAKS